MTDAAPTEIASQTHAAGDIAQLTGLEMVRRLANGSIPPPAMVNLLPFMLLPPEPGQVELRAKPDERVLNLTRTVHGGWIMTMLDTAMALAGHTTLGPGEVCPTHETSVKYVRPITYDSAELRVLGRVLARGRSVITLEGRIEDAGGKLFAHGTSTCLVVRKGA